MNFLSARAAKILGMIGALISGVVMINDGQIVEGVGIIGASLSSATLIK